MLEEWRDIVGFEGYYQVSNSGNVKSLKRVVNLIDGRTRTWNEHLLSKHLDPVRGYLSVDLKIMKIKKRKTIHRAMAEAFFIDYDPSKDVDHINGIRSDNNLYNLRMATREQNNANSFKQQNTSSKYKGVCWDKNRNKWIAFIRVPSGKRLSLGRFNIETKAAAAYDNKLLEYFGEYAKTNKMLGLL